MKKIILFIGMMLCLCGHLAAQDEGEIVLGAERMDTITSLLDGK